MSFSLTRDVEVFARLAGPFIEPRTDCNLLANQFVGETVPS
jgi:hypothetical protein